MSRPEALDHEASPEEVLAVYEQYPEAGVHLLSVLCRLRRGEVSRILKSFGIVSTRDASSKQESGFGTVATLAPEQWAYVSGFLAAQKKGVHVAAAGGVRIYITAADPRLLEALAGLLGVGEVNSFKTNKGRNVQWVYRVGRASHVKEILTKVLEHSPGGNEFVEAGLTALGVEEVRIAARVPYWERDEGIEYEWDGTPVNYDDERWVREDE